LEQGLCRFQVPLGIRFVFAKSHNPPRVRKQAVQLNGQPIDRNCRVVDSRLQIPRFSSSSSNTRQAVVIDSKSEERLFVPNPI
jgi:hypothetical protein